MKFLAVLIFAGVLVLAAYVRFAPSDAARWHVAPPEGPKRWKGGVIEVVDGGQNLFAALDKAARATPRTALLAGSVAEGRVTFVTRSLYWGFPDYTTIELGEGSVTLYARLRFGRSDFGVNAARVKSWLQSAQALDGGGGAV